MSDAPLASLPGNQLPGLDMGQVERERKEMWSRMFQKYEDMEEMDEMSEEVTLEDIDKPETVEKIFKKRLHSQFVQPSSTVKQYLMEHADEMDEIATIAGPPDSDEEDLSDDSEDELYSSGSDAYNVHVAKNILTPASMEDIDLDDDNDDDYDENVNGTLVGINEDDDLYNAAPMPETKNLYDSNHNPRSFYEPNNKKPRLKSPSRSCIDQPSDEGILMICQEVTNSRETDEDDPDCLSKKPNIVCCECLTSTFYYALPVREQLVCDECLAGDHRDCEVEECVVCKEVGELISLRRQAEVFGRVEQRKLELSCSGLNEKTDMSDEDVSDTRIVVKESLKKPSDNISPTKLLVNAVDAATIDGTNDDEGAHTEPDIGMRQSSRSTPSPSPGDNARGPLHQFLPPLAQCGAGDNAAEPLHQFLPPLAQCGAGDNAAEPLHQFLPPLAQCGAGDNVGEPLHQFLPPLAQCGAGQYPSSLVSQAPHHKYSLNKVYPGSSSSITLYYCCTKKSQGCKGKCKVRLDKENKVELVLFSNTEHSHH